jgi:hypothetical protein
MGAAQSGVITTEEFKNYLYGTVLLMLTPQIDPQFRFVECANIKEEDRHVMPLVSSNPNLTVEEMLVEYTRYYGSNSGKEEAIDKYVKEHILDSNEHMMTFIKCLVAQLQDRKHRDRTRVPEQAARRQAQAHTQAHTQDQSARSYSAGPEASVRSYRQPEPTHEEQPTRIRGHNKLQRRLVALGQALDSEQALYQQQQQLQLEQQQQQQQLQLEQQMQQLQLEQSYTPVSHSAQGVEEIYAEEQTQEGDYEGQTYSNGSQK